jgi:hypothetical protein
MPLLRILRNGAVLVILTIGSLRLAPGWAAPGIGELDCSRVCKGCTACVNHVRTCCQGHTLCCGPHGCYRCFFCLPVTQSC